jgi:UV DNA damage endonuclease
MLRYLGFVSYSLRLEVRPNRGTVLRLATPERLRQLVTANLDALRQTLIYALEHDIRMFRISSDIIPFGGHPVNTLPWWDEFAQSLAEIGALIRDAGMRVSMHPGQYTLLSSPDAAVTANAFADLAWHARFLDALGVGPECKIVVHVGGAYGDKRAAMLRWAARYRDLPPAARRRLVLENDERLFGVEDVLELATITGVPIVFDVFHHRVMGGMPLAAALAAAFATWREEDGPPKTHISSQEPSARPGTHARYVEPDDAVSFLAVAPPQPFDVMLEAKEKDLALFALRAALAERGIYEAHLAPMAESEGDKKSV